MDPTSIVESYLRWAGDGVETASIGSDGTGHSRRADGGRCPFCGHMGHCPSCGPGTNPEPR